MPTPTIDSQSRVARLTNAVSRARVAGQGNLLQATGTLAEGLTQVSEATQDLKVAGHEALQAGVSLFDGTTKALHGGYEVCRGVQSAVNAGYQRSDAAIFGQAGTQAKDALKLGFESVCTLAEAANNVATPVTNATASETYTGMAARLTWAAAASPFNAVWNTPSAARASANLVSATGSLLSAAKTATGAGLQVVHAAITDQTAVQSTADGSTELASGFTEVGQGGYGVFSAATNALGATGTLFQGAKKVASATLAIANSPLVAGRALRGIEAAPELVEVAAPPGPRIQELTDEEAAAIEAEQAAAAEPEAQRT
jgi:hypothetical protein